MYHLIGYILLFCCLLLSACQPAVWRPTPLEPVQSPQEQAYTMIRACGAGKYKGQQLSQLPGSATAFCQPREKGRQLCAILVLYPETRVYTFTDARRYTAVAQARAWFNIVVDENTRVLQCRSEIE